jgi:hypothetical protein
MGGRIPVYVYADDPVLQNGVVMQLRRRPEVDVVDAGEPDSSQVAIVVADAVDEQTMTVTRALRRGGVPRVVLVVAVLDEAGILAGVEIGVCGFVPVKGPCPPICSAASSTRCRRCKPTSSTRGG